MRGGAGIRAQRHPPHPPQAREDHSHCSLPGLSPQYKQGKRTHVLFIKCPMSRHLIRLVGPRRYPLFGALSRRLNYARDPARGWQLAMHTVTRAWGRQAVQRGGGAHQAPCCPSQGQWTHRSPSCPGIPLGGTKPASLGLGMSVPLRSFLVLSVLTRCWFWKVPLPHEAQMRMRAPKRRLLALPGRVWEAGCQPRPRVSWERGQPSWAARAGL